MRKIVLLAMVIALIFSTTACSDSENQGGNSGKLVLEENAVGAGVNIRNLSPEEVRFFIDPLAYEDYESEDGGESMTPNGIYGSVALVAAKIKGENAEVDGSFSLYANDKSGPSVTIQVKGSFGIDELFSFDNSYFFNYQDGQFVQMTKEEWTSYN